MDPTTNLTEETRATVSASGVLLIVMSKRYLGSSWCRDELEWFRRQIQDRAADNGRVFVLRAQQTDESLWPEFLRDERGRAMLGFSFYDPATGYPLGWPDLNDITRDFVRELYPAADDLDKAAARAARSRGKTRRGRGGTRRARRAESPILRAAHLLHAPPESETVRADIGRALTGDGMCR